jgi:hypothetical protein
MAVFDQEIAFLFLARTLRFAVRRYNSLSGHQQMQKPSACLARRRLTSALLCLLVLASRLEQVVAQEFLNPVKSVEAPPATPAAPRKEAGSVPAKPPGGSPLPGASSRFLPNQNHELIEVPNGASVEDYFEFLKNRNKETGPPAATISAIEIAGTADDERAVLKATIVVRLPQGDQFVRVPVFFNEAVLTSWDCFTDGEFAPAVKDKDSDQGYAWWFRGRGPHRLELVLSFPLKKQLLSRRLVATLPVSPTSHVQIELPYSSVTPKVPEQTIVDVKSTGERRSVLEASLSPGARLDLTWTPNPDIRSNEVSLESQTTIRALIETDGLQLRVKQEVKSLQGPFDRFIVRLPVGADSIKLDDPERQSFRIDGDNRQRAIVSLKEKSTSAQLNWTLRLPARMRMPVVLEGFAVEGPRNEAARKQVGKIGLSLVEGLHLLTEPRDQSVIRINAGEFPASTGSVSRGYQFLSQPFKLPITFDDVKPYFQVKPQLLLTASGQQLSLDGKFEFHVDRDSLQEVVLTWPDHKSEGWIIDAVDEPGIVESYSIDEKGQITARLVKRQSGTFALHIRAHRLFKAGDEVVFSLPRPKGASRLSPSNVILLNSENVETDLVARGETVMQLMPSSLLESLVLTDSERRLKGTVFRVDTDEHLFQLQVTPQKQRIRTESTLDATWEDDQFRLIQRLIYDVSYERLSQIRVTVPSTIDPDRLHFFTSRDVELSPELLPGPAGATRQVQLKPGESQLGRFEIQARYTMPFPRESAFDTDAPFNMPILGSLDEPFSRTRVSLTQSDWFDAEPLSVDVWKAQLTPQAAWQWLAEGSPSSLSLKLTRSTHANGTGSVSRALMTVHLDAAGHENVRAQFRVTTRASSLPIVLPETASPISFFWDDKHLSDHECVESPPDSRRFTLQLPDQTEDSQATVHLLTVDYQDRFGSGPGWSDSLRLRSPQLPKCSLFAQVVWQTVLPPGQHMFTYPPSATPMFRWQRTGLCWSRISDPAPERLQEWVTAGTTGPPSSDSLISEKIGNLYSFSQFGSPQPLVFQTLSSPMVLLFGAGFSLAVGFVMLRLVVLRHVLTLLLTGLCLAIFGLWYAAPLELLLQPMVAGLIFPAVAVWLDGSIRRRYDTAVLSFDGQGDFPPMQAFGSHFVVRQTDPNEATLHRPATPDSRPGVPVESGSGVS